MHINAGLGKYGDILKYATPEGFFITKWFVEGIIPLPSNCYWASVNGKVVVNLCPIVK